MIDELKQADSQNSICSSFEFPQRACLFTFSSRNVLPTVDKHMFDVFVAKVQNERGIQLFLHWK